MLPLLTCDSMLEKKVFFSWVDIIGKLSALYEPSNPQTHNFLNDECLKRGLNSQPFWPHLKALTTKPTPHMMIKTLQEI